ncbi:PP2C family protein-serine/threonine phosphatase [Zoogloea sp.]|uniref:PP2C family protein-serine/threonine phosphatase n=1 Tax=Zoogloea sp. TaxID=49181 RepID=UPI002611AC78|nr:PP2C family protein-serine/threonine phosphatase [Zoogloea sp.]MDD3355060.1 PP2C family protein-serine/threonine phosphatase [Zoogloea sp.]
MTRMMRPDRLDASAMEYWMQSADRMGGDLVAAARSPHGRYYVMLADATGHGLPAAINLLPINRVFYTMVRKNLPVGLIAERMNASVRDQSPPGRFVVALILCFDQANRLLEVWNGGIPMALFLNEAGQIVRRFTSENLPLGLDEGGAPPHTVFHRWEGEGQFFACSDGLTDAESPEGKPLGEAPVEMALAAAPASRRFNQLRRVVHEHMVGQAPHDDLTALMVDTRKLLPAVAAAEHGETGK